MSSPGLKVSSFSDLVGDKLRTVAHRGSASSSHAGKRTARANDARGRASGCIRTAIQQ